MQKKKELDTIIKIIRREREKERERRARENKVFFVFSFSLKVYVFNYIVLVVYSILFFDRGYLFNLNTHFFVESKLKSSGVCGVCVSVQPRMLFQTFLAHTTHVVQPVQLYANI